MRKMLRGDISNRESPILAFNIDNLLFENEQKANSLKQRFVKAFGDERSKHFNRNVSKVFESTLRTLWDRYNYSIYLVTYNDKYIEAYEELFAEIGLCYTRVVSFDSLEELRMFIYNRCTLYLDSDLQKMSTISSNKAVNFKDLWDYVGGR